MIFTSFPGRRLVGTLLLTVALAALPAAAAAETLTEVLSRVYTSSPALDAARARLSAVSEGTDQAMAGFMPNLSFNAGVGGQYSRTDLGSSGSIITSGTRPTFVELRLVQPLFDGLRASYQFEKADAQKRAEREALKNVEQGAMYSATEAFLRIIASQQIVAIRDRELAFLNDELGVARDRVDSGQSSGTDLAQAEARVFAAETGRNAALAQLEAWRARFVQYVGVEPGRLSAAKRIGEPLPRDVDAAVDEALKNHPAILAASFNSEAVRASIGIAGADGLPQLNLEGSLTHSWDTSGAQTIDSAYVGVKLAVPIFDGGATSSRVREAGSRLVEADMQLSLTRSEVAANIKVAWSDYRAAALSIQSATAQVAAQRKALDGVKAEERIGARTTLDILNAQSELVNAEINLVEARAQNDIAAYAILAAMGKLDAETLKLPVQYITDLDQIRGAVGALAR